MIHPLFINVAKEDNLFGLSHSISHSGIGISEDIIFFVINVKRAIYKALLPFILFVLKLLKLGVGVVELFVIKEKSDLILNGGEKVITAILPVMDDMERALEQMRKAEDVQAVVEGVELIQKKFMGILEKQGVKSIETKDADFDVEVHEAVAQFPAPAPEMKNKVVDCTLKGYKLNEKVIRHAQVVVGI